LCPTSVSGNGRFAKKIFTPRATNAIDTSTSVTKNTSNITIRFLQNAEKYICKFADAKIIKTFQLMTTFFIIGLTVFMSYRAFQSRSFFEKAKFIPYRIARYKEYERAISHLFVHANWEHLIFNMLTLFFFGNNTEAVLSLTFGNIGTAYYLTLYLAGGIVASLYSFAKHKHDFSYSAIGASGAVSAVLFANILFNPNGKIYLFFIPIGIPAFLFGPLYLLYSAYMAKKETDNIGHDAHFLGAVFGFVFPIILNRDFFLQFVNKIALF